MNRLTRLLRRSQLYDKFFALARTTGYSRRAQFLVVGLSIAYLVALLVLGLHDVGRLDWQQYLLAFSLGIALYPISLFSQAAAWALLSGYLRWQAVRLDWSDVLIYSSSYLLRRLPGGIWQVAGRVASYRQIGVRATTPVPGRSSSGPPGRDRRGDLLLLRTTTLPDLGGALRFRGHSHGPLWFSGWLGSGPTDRRNDHKPDVFIQHNRFDRGGGGKSPWRSR